MTLQHGDHLTVLTVSVCGRYALVAWAKGLHIVEERIAVHGLRKARYNVTKHGRRCYQDVLVIES